MDISSGDVHMNLWSDVDQIKIDLVQESTGGEEVGTNDVDNLSRNFPQKESEYGVVAGWRAEKSVHKLMHRRTVSY